MVSPLVFPKTLTPMDLQKLWDVSIVKPPQAAQELFTNPVLLPPSHKRFSPIVIMIMGRRNAGKTYTSTILADIQQRRFKAHSWDKIFKVASNYNISFAEIRSQYIIDDIMGFPDWAHDLSLYIDEIQTAATNRRPMSQHAVGISLFLTMIRKRRIEVVFTTQFPQTIDPQVLIQVDLFIETSMRDGGKIVDLFIHDFWGQFTGRNYRKKWPPQRWEADKVNKLYVPNPYRVFNMYNTDEVIAPVTLKDRRDELIEHEYESRGWQHLLPMGDAAELRQKEMALAAERQADYDADNDSLQGMLRTAPDQFFLTGMIGTFKTVDPTITTQEILITRLKDLGYIIGRQNGAFFATKPNVGLHEQEPE